MEKIKIAIVDDEAEYIKDLARGLEILGYDVIKAVSGSRAIALINSEKPKVVLCDYKLGDMDGTQIIGKTKPDNPTTVYIMVTAYYDEAYSDAFKKAGADEVLYKPIQLIELDNVIKNVLANRKG